MCPSDNLMVKHSQKSPHGKGGPLLPYEEAVQMLEARCQALAPAMEPVGLPEAMGRILAQEVAMDRPEPPVDRSAMDGFAMASADGEAPRRIVGTYFAGTPGQERVGAGEAVAVMTGGTVPPGTDCVVPVERTKREGDLLHLESAPTLGQHVRMAGEMGERGRVLLRPGHRLQTADLGAIAGCGVETVETYRRPRVAILATGDEVVPYAQSPEPHQVRDSNRLLVAAQCADYGMEVVLQAQVPDVREDLAAAVDQALAEADLLVTIGGVSMGEKDYLPQVFADAGVEKLFHKVAMQPGKPVWAGVRGERFVLGLPGNPLSAFVMTELLVRMLAERLQGGTAPFPRPLELGRLQGQVRSGARPRLILARRGAPFLGWQDLEAEATALSPVTPCAETGSGDWTTLGMAEMLLVLPPHTEVQDGDPVHYLAL